MEAYLRAALRSGDIPSPEPGECALHVVAFRGFPKGAEVDTQFVRIEKEGTED